MKKILTLILSTLLTAYTVISAQAEQTINPITIIDAYAFATPTGSKTGAAFMIIHNASTEEDYLVDVNSDVARINEIHENILDPDDGTMMMRKIKSITVPANGNAILEPPGKHIMLIKLPEPLTMDSQFPLTLVFEKSGEQKIMVDVIAPGSKPKRKN